MQRAPRQNDGHEQDRAARSLNSRPQNERERQKKQNRKKGAGDQPANLCRDDTGAKKQRGDDGRFDVSTRGYPS